MQIGTVFASEEYVCPNAVGVDIGCGMCAVPVDGLHKDDLSLHDKLQLQSLIKVHGKVASHIACDIIVDSGSFIQASCYTVNSEWLLQQADCM